MTGAVGGDVAATWSGGPSPSPSQRGKRAAKVSRPTVAEASRTRMARLGSSPSSCFPLKIWPNYFIPQMTLSDGIEAPVYINWGREETTHPKQPGGCPRLKHSRGRGHTGPSLAAQGLRIRFQGGWIHLCVRPSPSALHLKLSHGC